MTIEEFKSSLDAEMLYKVKDVCAKDKDVTEADAKVLYDFIIDVASPALGEDNVGEPFRYLCSSTNGVRIDDLKAVIGEDFNTEVWSEFCTGLGFDLFVKRNLTPNCEVTDFRFPPIRVSLQKLMGEGAYRACASDLGYHLLEHCQAGDPVRDLQTMHLLLDGDEAAAAAEYISQAEGESLRLAVMTMGNALKDGPEYVQQCVFDLPLVQSEKVDQKKILMLQLNDCIAIVGNPDRQKVVAEKLHNIIGSMIRQGNNEITVLLGIAKLRIAQSARTRAQIAHQQQKEEEAKEFEQQAQQAFIGALNYLMPPLQQADPTTISDEQVRQYWLCLKICQEMAQPKAISLLFEAIVKVEQAQIAALANKHADTSEVSEEVEADEKRAHQLSTNIIDQHIDMSKLYYQMPQPLQEQFTNYSEGCISLIQAYLDGLNKEGEDNEKGQDEELRLCNFYQTMGELYDHLGKTDESYDAYTEAQIRQMRYLAALKKEDEEAGIQMSQRSLIARLTLSVTNHNLGLYYRKEGKSQRDLSVLLRSNMDMALDCFKAYPRDGRVIHFVINAALELGDLQHKSKGLKAECDTYTRVISQFGVLNNLRLDQQLCVDMAMIHTKCGQCQADDNIRRYRDALRNLDVAQKLWSSLAQNTKNPEFQKNAEAVAKMMKQIGK
ncbi:MAG: hypothetical protein IKO08_06320 [Bacteroidales bacterium]|nr:hypothetical protein [Bacteroidales bacterium]